MTALAEPGSTRTGEPKAPVAFSRPGFLERAYVVATMFLLVASLPTDWFTEATRATGENNNATQGILPTLVFTVLYGIAILLLAGNWRVVMHLVKGEPLVPIFIALCFLSTLWADNAFQTQVARRSVSLGLTSLFAYYLVVRFDLADILRLFAVALSAFTFLNIIWIVALPQYGRVGASSARDADAWTGVTLNKNQLGLRMVLAIVVFLIMARTNRRFRTWYYFMAAISALMIALSNSKTSLGNLILLSGMTVVYLMFRSRKTLFGAVALAMASAVVGATLFATANLDFITSTFDRDITLSGRTTLWGDLMPIIASKPILGHGWTAFWNGFSSPAHEIWIRNIWLPPHGHNAFIDIALQLGLVGLALFVGFFFRAIIRATRHIRDTKTAVGLFPLLMLSLALVTSITESGVIGRGGAWVMFLVAILTVTTDSRRSIALTTAEQSFDPR